MQWYIEYQTTEYNQNHWVTMPHKVKISGSTPMVARIRFGAIFKECFGDILEYRILRVDTTP